VADEEVKRVFDAIEGVDRIADPEARSRARAQITARTRELSSQWNAERTELAQRMQGEGESVRGIAKRLGIQPGTVQDLLRGYKGSGTTRPKKAPGE
jgi:transposase